MKIRHLQFLAIISLLLTSTIEAHDYPNTVYQGMRAWKNNNYHKAVRYFSDACDNGYQLGCVNLGAAYYRGEGVKRDLTKSKELFESSCYSEDRFGCLNLGYMYEYGQGVEMDKITAKNLYGQSCEHGNQKACNKYKDLDQLGVK